MLAEYGQTIGELVKRIEALARKHPDVYKMDSPFELFKHPEFQITDLDPSLAQASFALAYVQKMTVKIELTGKEE